MSIIMKLFLYVFLGVSIIMIFQYLIGILKTITYMRQAKENDNMIPNKKVSMLITIPVLREQSIICDTIEYFSKLKCNNVVIHLCIAGTKREYESLSKYGKTKGTIEVVKKFCANKSWENGFTVDYFEADDVEQGDRATQLNYAVKSFIKKQIPVDVIGVYDADSRPSEGTLLEVAYRYLGNMHCSYQQPAFFMDAVCEMSKKKENPLLIANALYQNTWSIISEIPMWINYSESCGAGKGNFYCIGHGEFFDVETYKEFEFPEHEVTDGIQIGYRLGMSGQDVKILSNYCSDDVPHDLKSLIGQHRRWFGGCMRLKQAYSWCKEYRKQAKLGTLISGYWSQFRWAFTANLYLLSLIISCGLSLERQHIFLVVALILGLIYCYLFPLIGVMVTPYKGKKKVSFVSFLCVPLAIYIKGIGPNIYIFNTLMKRKNTYGKVER